MNDLNISKDTIQSVRTKTLTITHLHKHTHIYIIHTYNEDRIETLLGIYRSHGAKLLMAQMVQIERAREDGGR